MVHIQDIFNRLQGLGAGVVVILSQSRERMREYLEEKAFPFPVLSDASRDVAKRYGVYVRVNFESMNIARPAIFLLDREGIIRYIFIASVQVETPSDHEILSTLESISG